MQYNNMIFFIGDDNLYELIFNTSYGYKCRNIETKEISYIKKQPINISSLDWSGLSLSEIFEHIRINNDKFNNSPLNEFLTQKALKWYLLLKKNNVSIPKKEYIQPFIEEPKKKIRKKNTN